MSAKGRKRAEAPATEVAAPTVVLASDRFTLYRGDHDLVDIGTVIAPESIDAIVTDPPSGIEFMGKDWDSDKGGRDHWIAWLAGIMRRALVLLKPGGHALVWALPRTSHWTATAVEDAGFEIRDVGIHLFGTGFPKSLDVSKAIDEALGVERAVVGLKRYADGRTYQGGEQSGRAGMMSEGQERGPSVETAPATPEAARFVGIGTALKPAYEGWVLARKPIAILDAVRMVDGCLSSLYASIAVEDSASSRAAQPENPRPDSAVKPAGRRRVTSGASSAAMATSPCASAIDSSLSIVSSWRRTLAECSDLASTSTIGMASSLTTDLQTLNSSASRITAASMLRPESSHDGSMSLVQDVARRFAVLQAKCDAIRLLSVTASAGEQADRRYGSASGPLVGDDGMPGDVGSENWILARKPLAGTVAQNVLAFGTGGLNIDACRIGTSDNLNGGAYYGEARPATSPTAFAGRGVGEFVQPVGRWPAHVTLDEDAARALDEQSGVLQSGSCDGGFIGDVESSVALGDKRAMIRPGLARGDSGGASRFFYIAKPARSEKDAGLDHLPIRTGGEATDREEGSAGLNNPRAGSGRTGGVRNHHPTVKSVDLMRWLCRLITPRGGTVLDLFTGSGTTGIAALAEGMRFIGIERDAAFCDVAAGRLAHAACLPTPDRIADDGKPVEAPRQPSLFDTLGATP